MARPYKVMMERATKLAYSSNELMEAQHVAVVREFQKAPVNEIRTIVERHTEGVLLVDGQTLITQLEDLRVKHPGSPVVNGILDEIVVSVLGGDSYEGIFDGAVDLAVESRCESAARQIEGHYRNKVGTIGLPELRARMGQARNSGAIKSITKDILSNIGQRTRTRSISKKTGIEEGVSLSGAAL